MNELSNYKKELEIELENILCWWGKMTIDKNNGGFVGKIDHHNTVYPQAPKGSVLNCRILWAFSSAYRLLNRPVYLETAQRAYDFFDQHFIDRHQGGVYWTVDFQGNPLDTKKRIYAQAFAVYALTEFYLASNSAEAKTNAIAIYNDIVEYSHDKKFKGYYEAFTNDWKETDDLRLSPKDANEKKSMNTHLHLLEAFTNLYRVLKDGSLRQRVTELIAIFSDHIIDRDTHHLTLFFDERWNPRSKLVSFGHDIEAAWLLQQAAETLEDASILSAVKEVSAKIATAAAGGLDSDGGLWYEYDSEQKHLINEKHSWPQAEAMIGFFNAWENTRNEKFLERSLQSWNFVKEYLLDKNLGEWYWGVNADHSPMIDQDKVGIWKCPYHNSRACMEIIRRIDKVLNER